jgi:hypothetical protein
MNKITSILITILVQLIIVGLVFLGFLLDPLIGVWIVGIYFSVIGSFLTYYFFTHQSALANNIK